LGKSCFGSGAGGLTGTGGSTVEDIGAAAGGSTGAGGGAGGGTGGGTPGVFKIGVLTGDSSPLAGEVIVPPQYGQDAVVGGRSRGTTTMPLQWQQGNCFLSLGMTGFSMYPAFPEDAG
jgi:hypothetical protein